MLIKLISPPSAALGDPRVRSHRQTRGHETRGRHVGLRYTLRSQEKNRAMGFSKKKAAEGGRTDARESFVGEQRSQEGE